MSSIKTIGTAAVALLVVVLFLAGCGTPNDANPFDADTQQHKAGWLPADHSTAAGADIESCRECHGEDLLGGIVGVGCTTCHLGGPTAVHPGDWSGDLSLHPVYVAANGKESCRNAYCHGPFLTGVPLSGPSCANYNNDSRCHQAIP